MSKEQIRVLWCLETWKAMCIWTGQDHGSFGRGCNGVDWLSPSLWEHPIFFCSSVSPTSSMPNDIWKHVTHTGKQIRFWHRRLSQSDGIIWKAHCRITLSVPQWTPSPILLLLTSPLSAVQQVVLPKTDLSHQGAKRIFMFSRHLKQTCKSHKTERKKKI